MRAVTTNPIAFHKVRRARGKRPFDEKIASVIHAAILRSPLADVQFFTRESLLQLTPLQHVATITRYGYVREAVHVLIRQHKLVELTRTELCIAGKESLVNMAPLTETYGHTIRTIVAQREIKKPFDVMDIVRMWTAERKDLHLTESSKRTAVRQELHQLAHRGKILARDDFTYIAEAKFDE